MSSSPPPPGASPIQPWHPATPADEVGRETARRAQLVRLHELAEEVDRLKPGGADLIRATIRVIERGPPSGMERQASFCRTIADELEAEQSSTLSRETAAALVPLWREAAQILGPRSTV